jgi:hypothetical protein
MDKKVTQMPGTKSIPSLKEAVTKMIEELPTQLEFYRLKAKLQREYFLALKKEGFLHSEALELTKGMM